MTGSQSSTTGTLTHPPSPPIPGAKEGESGAGAVLFVVLLIALLLLLVRATSKRRRPPQTTAAGEPLIAISQLPPELREPLKAFWRRGVEYLTADEVRRIYDECSRLAEGRARLFEQQTALLQAQSAHELAIAAAKFISALSPEERALLHLRVEAQTRLHFDQLRAENAQLASEVARYRSLRGFGR